MTEERQRVEAKILGDFTNVMQANADGTIDGKLFKVECDPEQVKALLERECYISASSEAGGKRCFVMELPIQLKRVTQQAYFQELQRIALDRAKCISPHAGGVD